MAPPATAKREPAGQLACGQTVEAVTLTHPGGVSARILTYGATLQGLLAPDADGVIADVILGHDDVTGYERTRAYLGSTIGRYANRIAGGCFTIDGTVYRLDQNNGGNTLHGGEHGFDQVVWSVESISEGDAPTLMLSHVSPDGEGGFPGELRATVAYTLDGAGDLRITFEATTTRATVVCMTNHALFNLAGDGAAQGAMLHDLTIAAGAFTPVDRHAIPTGEIRTVQGTAFDFRQGRCVADGVRDGNDPQIVLGRGYDHNFVLDKGATAQPQLAATLVDPVSGRRLDVLTTEPGLQIYTANAYDGTNRGKCGRLYRMGDGIALEPQKFPDTPNQPAFGSARLDPGQSYHHTMIYRLSAISRRR